ncbi:MAG: glyoxylase I family protein [Polyangiales bacterium]|jgi:glyoxylase I family protein
MSLTFHHHAILVSDLDLAEAFYGSVLGLVIKRRWLDEEKRPRSLWFALGNEAFLAIELHDSCERPDFGHHCFALAIDAGERGEWLRRLGAAEVTIEKLSDFSIYFRDPEGNQIALSHWPQEQNRPKPSG